MHKSVVTLGTFDGVHRGHQSILKQVVARARARGARSVALAFDMPPRHSRSDPAKPVLLTTLDEKLRLLRGMGIDQVQVLRFTPELAHLEPEAFFSRVVLGKWNAAEMIVGPRLAFGRNRRGRVLLLRRLGRKSDVLIKVVPPVRVRGQVVSSRRIRAAIERGDVGTAAAFLGRLYSLEGTVVHGDHRGRSLGYPTANLAVHPQKMLPAGVFWVQVIVGKSGKRINGLCNVGSRPTFHRDSGKKRCEVFLFSKPNSLYGRTLRVFFLKKLRDEKRFGSAAELVRQIDQDFARAKRMSAVYR